jgi:hypothetical protein
MGIEQSLSRLSADMQSAGASQNPWYLAQLAAQDAATAGGGSFDDLLNQAYERLGLPYTPSAVQKTGSEQNQPNPQVPDNPTPEGQGSGETPGGTKGTDVSGPMDDATRKAMGVMGAVTPGIFGVSPFSALGWASDLAGWAGVPNETDPAYGLADVQDVTDTFGAYAGASSAAKNQAAVSAFNDMVAADESGYADYSSGKTTPGGFASPGNPGTPSVGNPDQQGGVSVGARGSQNPGTPGYGFGGWADENDPSRGADTAGGASMGSGSASGGGFGGGAPGDGRSEGGTGPGIKKGGVFQTSKPRTEKITWGEKGTGGETAIFVPKNIKSPEKDQVIMALEQLLFELKGKQNGV